MGTEKYTRFAVVLLGTMLPAVLYGCIKGTAPNETRPSAGAAAHVDTPELRAFLATRTDRERRSPEGHESVSEAQLKSLERSPAAPLDPRMLEFGSALPKSAAFTCNIGLNDSSSLLIIPDQAKFTFASFPFYIQQCGDGWVHVKENDRGRYGQAWGSDYGHYHLVYERGEFCLTPGGQSGIMSGSSCVAVNPLHEPRFVGSHQGDQWIRAYTYSRGLPEMLFSLKEIKVKAGAGIRLYFRRSTGEWRVWNRLPPGWWNLSEAANIKEILIRGADGGTPYFFDDMLVSVP